MVDTVKLRAGENKESHLLMFPGGFALLSPDDIRVIPLSKQKLPQPGKMAFHGGAEQCVEDMHFLVPGATLLTLSLSLLELMTRVPTHHLPRGSSSFISQQRESDRFPFLPSYSPRERYLSVCPWQWRQRPWFRLATFHAASDLQPQRSGWAWRQQNGKR